MYEAYYGFEEKPFTLSPDPKYLFLSGTHREVLGHLLYGIEQGEGFMAISGEVGTGKTTLCRTLLDRLGASCEIAFLFNPTLTPTDLIKAINGEFGLSTFGDSRPELLDVLNTFLLDQNALGRRVLVIIDEAQNLPGETLEQLRLLSNLESRTAKLLQIILIGQPELDETLEASELHQLRQRITVWWRLGPLAEGETGEYVRHRLRVASGGSDRPIFSDAALARVHRMRGGVPRLVNVLCDRALLAGFAAQASEITPAIVNEAAAEMRLGRRGESLPARSVGDRAARWRRRLALAAGLAADVAVGAVVGWSLRRGTPPAPPPPVAAAAPAIALPAPAPPQVAAPAVAAEEEPPAEAPDEPLLWDDPLDNLFALEPPRATNGRALAAMLDAWGLPSADPGEPSFPQALATLEESGLQVLRVASLDEILALGLPALVGLRDADGQLRAVLVR
ncbi:MAG: ExeA family protein, partial [Myxococcota bacterium]